MNSWGTARNMRDLVAETSNEKLLSLDIADHKRLLFDALRAGNLAAIRNLFATNRTLLATKLGGYEGADVYETIPNSRTKRCYTFTGKESDGYFYPLHVAAEAGHKQLTLLLIKAGADTTLTDFKGSTAEQRSNGEAMYAFYEVRGLKFEATERYEGGRDAKGRRSGSGSLYRKAEGYRAKERLIYRGGWKNDQFNGQGSLFWEEADLAPPTTPGKPVSKDEGVEIPSVIKFVGRFRNGVLHGRGTGFDERGDKIYVGTFREGKRDGRGVEYHGNPVEVDTLASSNARLTATAVGPASVKEPTVAYRGEFFADQRHGFGAAYYEEGQRYVGRFDGGNMSGVGLYMHPNGERYEGLFYNNKPDGSGSFYQKDPVMGTFTASHALWALGRKSKELTTAFEPDTSVDLPDDSVTENSLALEMAVKQYSMNPADFVDLIPETLDEEPETPGVGISLAPAGAGEVAGAQGAPKPKWQRLAPRSPQVPPPAAGGKGQFGAKSNASPIPSKSALTPVKAPLVPTAGNAWKLNLAKYVRLTNKEMALFGIVNDSDEDIGATGGEGMGMDEDMLGTHFLEVPPLYVAYVYVTTSAKIFECRAATREFQEVVPDFTLVNHLVIDIIDGYNDSVEREAKVQMEMKAQDIMAQNYQEQNAPKLTYKEQQLANAAAAAASNAPAPLDSAVVTATPIVKAQRKFSLKAVASTVALGVAITGKSGGGTASPAPAPSASGAANAAKRMFMSDAEKKKDLVLKQRAELAAKKALKELPPELTRKLSAAALDELERELVRLIGGAVSEPSTMAAESSVVSSGGDTSEGGGTESDGMGGDVGVESYSHREPENEYAAELLNLLRTARSVT